MTTKNKYLPANFNKEAFALAAQKLFTASSASLNKDCYGHALLAHHALNALGIQSEVIVGYAAWRVDGQAPGAVISHHVAGAIIPEPGAEVYHAWLKVGNDIVDLTTYQLTQKAAILDSYDGQVTPVNWCPDFLWVKKNTVSTYQRVAQGFKAGLYSYDRIIALEKRIKQSALPVCNEEIATLLMIYRTLLNGDITVGGVNTVQQHKACS